MYVLSPLVDDPVDQIILFSPQRKPQTSAQPLELVVGQPHKLFVRVLLVGLDREYESVACDCLALGAHRGLAMGAGAVFGAHLLVGQQLRSLLECSHLGKDSCR